MATTFNWTVTQMDCYPQAEGETDVVFVVHWTCAGVDGGYTAAIYNTCPVTYTAGTPYTPYADLTQEQVLGWVWASEVDKDMTEATVAQLIQLQINPPVVSPPLPWAE